MKAKGRPTPDDMESEYKLDYATAERGKYYRQLLKEGANIAVLEPDIAQAFQSSAAVNQALRALLEMSEATRRLTAEPKGRSRTPGAARRKAARRAVRR
jgi:hypothetical protein